MSKTEETEDKSMSNEQAVQENDDIVTELEVKIAELEQENSELKDQYLRKQADFENFRKRMFREKEEAIKFANSSLLEDLITIIDDFERAIKASSSAQDVESFKTGIEMIEKQFVGLLDRKYGLKRFDSAGTEFDPERHEAINTEETADHDTSMVVEEYQKGYFLHDRVLRHAKVKVSIPVSKEYGAEHDEQDNKNENNEGEE